MTSAPAGDTDEDKPLRPLAVGICSGCGSVRHPIPDHCPACRGALQRRVAATGRLWSWTVVRHAPPGFSAPYTIGWAQLDDVGIGVMGRFLTLSAGPVRFDAPVVVREDTVGAGPPRLWLAVEDE